MQIAVIGSGEAKGKLYKMAEEVGKEIAKAGAKKRGGLTVGILPGFEKEEANEYVDVKVVIVKGSGIAELLKSETFI